MNRAKVQLSAAEMKLVSDPGWILTKNAIMGKVVAVMAGLAERYQLIMEGGRVDGDMPGSAGDDQGWGEDDPGVSKEESRTAKEEKPREPPQAAQDDLRWTNFWWTKERAQTKEEIRLLREGLRSSPPPKISRGENYLGLPYVILDYPRVFGRQEVLAIRTMFWWGHYFSMTLHIKGEYRSALLAVIRNSMPLLVEKGFHIGISEDEWRHELTGDNYISLEGLDAPAIDDILDGDRSFLKLSAICGLDRWDDAPEVLEGLFRLLMGVISSPGGGTDL